MPINRGKQFEQTIKRAFEQISGVSIDRITDQTTKYRGSTNICDFIVYKKPYEYYIECKSVKGNTLPIYSNPKTRKDGTKYGFYGNISDAQWQGLLEKSKIDGVVAGIICWWIDRDVTRFIPIQTLQKMREYGYKSYKYDIDVYQGERSYIIQGKKKRVFIDYDLTNFFDKINAKVSSTTEVVEEPIIKLKDYERHKKEK